MKTLSYQAPPHLEAALPPDISRIPPDVLYCEVALDPCGPDWGSTPAATTAEHLQRTVKHTHCDKNDLM